MPNKFKGEVEIKINDENYTLRPTFNCLATIEGRLNTTISDIIGTFSMGSFNINVLSTVIWAGIKAYDENIKITPVEVGEKLFKQGILTFMGKNKDVDNESVVTNFLTFGILGEEEFKRVMEEKQERINKAKDEEEGNLDVLPDESDKEGEEKKSTNP